MTGPDTDSTGDVGRRETVDAQEVVGNLQARINDLEADLAEIRAEAEDLDRSDDDERERYTDLAAEHEQVAKDLKEAENALEKTTAKLDAWGGTEFTIKELGWTDQGRINDLVRTDGQRDREVAAEAAITPLKVRTIQVGTTATPPNAPDDPREGYPAPVVEWLYAKIDHLHRFGEVSALDFSLEGALQNGSNTSS